MKAEIGFWLSGQKNNLEKFIFYLLILFLPTQLGKHFWPDFSKVLGLRVDYLSPTIYTTDILIFLLFVFWILSKNKFLIKSQFLNFKTIAVFFMVFLLVGIFMSKSPQAGFFGLIKLFEFTFVGFYAATNINKFNFKNILLMFAFGIVFESFLAIAQFFNKGSLNGIFYFFGERFFTSQTPGIANARLNGELVLRPYGTLPHPNVLAGYLTIAMAIIIYNLQFTINNSKKSFYCFVIVIGTIALMLTLSRVAIVFWLMTLVYYFIRKFVNHKSYILILLLALLIFGSTTPLGLRFTDVNFSDESIMQREKLIHSSLLMIKDNPIFGVGLNNFLTNLPYYQQQSNALFYLQPVHNLFLLIASETGLIGLGFFVWFLIKAYKGIMSQESRIMNEKPSLIQNSLFIILSLVLVLGMFDHYFLTLQQGQLLLSFVLGLAFSLH